MNDWEIGGTQNKWVCPSDRHLQLRAQLKSGWSVRTATARSPTNSKQQSGITEAEQEHIKAVLARAEQGRICEQQRIGRLVDRLEKMKNRATGNGVTQCLLCSTDFGLLASKSYAAMCSCCRKYVCQKNCGVETYDSRRRETTFLCKICSEYREMWKKSGAWFYKEVPDYIKPAENGEVRSPPYYRTWQHHSKATSSNGSTPHKYRGTAAAAGQEQNEGTKSPRPRITPSWVREKVQSSMSIGSDDENASTSEGEGFSSKEELQKAPSVASRRIRPQKHGSIGKGSLQRFAISARNRVTDSEESADSRRTTPSTSPRHSPSSYGDDLSLNPSSIIASDAKSIDSGVVPSDQSALANVMLPQSNSLSGIQVKSDRHSPPQQTPATESKLTPSPPRTPSRSSSSGLPLPVPVAEQLTQERSPSIATTGTSSPSIAAAVLAPSTPPIPPRSSPSPQLITRRLSAASASSVTNRASASGQSSNEMLQQSSAETARQFQDEPTTSTFLSSPEDDKKCLPGKRIRSPSSWRSKSKALLSRVMSERLPSTRSSTSLVSACYSYAIEEPIVRRAASGSELPGSSSSHRPINANGARRKSPLLCFCLPRVVSSLGSIQFSLLYLPEEKKLIIKLFKAKNLKAMDKNGFSDPYVKFYLIPGALKATKLTSKTIEKTLDPEWNEEFTYHGITEDEKAKKTLRITVLDRDRIGSDFLGETRVPLKKLTPSIERHFNLYLENAMPVEKAKGEGERGKILVGVVYNVQQGSLFISIKRCAELIGMDSTGFSDPYVKVSLTPLTSKAHRQKTSTKKRTLNPEFNETLAFVVPFKDLPKKTLQIGVYDHDVAKQDDYIGGIVLSASAKGDRQKQWIYCMQNPGSYSEYWHKLELDS